MVLGHFLIIFFDACSKSWCFHKSYSTLNQTVAKTASYHQEFAKKVVQVEKCIPTSISSHECRPKKGTLWTAGDGCTLLVVGGRPEDVGEVR